MARGAGCEGATEKNPDRTLLDKHLADYTARNTFDYFIHKDLGGFLRREIDFYIKNEVMHLDDIESESASRVEQYLAKVRAIRRIAQKIIDFLARSKISRRSFGSRRNLLSRATTASPSTVSRRTLSEIAANDAQREEWVAAFCD